jgi:hypothetical protein
MCVARFRAGQQDGAAPTALGIIILIDTSALPGWAAQFGSQPSRALTNQIAHSILSSSTQAAASGRCSQKMAMPMSFQPDPTIPNGMGAAFGQM